MKIVSDNIKNSINKPTTQRKGRILVKDKYYDVYNVEYYADCYDDGNVIGNAIASQLNFDIPFMEKFDTFKYEDGVWTGTKYEYVDLGTFIVTDEQDEDEFTKHITAFDSLIKFNKPFEDKKDYPKTLYQELQNICLQADVELVNTSIANGDFTITENQFVNNETLKTVLKNICGASGTYAVIKNDKLNLQLKNETTLSLNKSQHEPITWKRKTYGINQVILGMKDVDGEYSIREDTLDIEKNGVHKLVINDNYFAYSQEKREQLIDAIFSQVKGFGYVPYEMTTEWLNYAEIGDTITLDGIETIVLRIDAKSPNSIESVISAPAVIDSAVEYYDNTNDINDRLKRAEIKVDKANQEITTIVQTQTDMKDDITNIQINSNTINATIQSIEKNTTDAIANTNENVLDLAQKVEATMTEEQVKLEISKELSNGVDKVTTSTGFTFNEDGLNVSKNGSEMSTQITEDGMTVTKNNEKMLIANNQGVDAVNLHASTYLIVGNNSRFEDFEDGGTSRTGCFWIGEADLTRRVK